VQKQSKFIGVLLLSKSLMYKAMIMQYHGDK